MTAMGLNIFGVDKDAINIYLDEFYMVEHPYHSFLKLSSGIKQAKWHATELVLPVINDEACLRFGAVINWDLVVTRV